MRAAVDRPKRGLAHEPAAKGAPLPPVRVQVRAFRCAPLSMLAIAAPLDEHGFDVVIVDAHVDPRWRESLRSQAEGAICAGITALTGYQLRQGLEGARILRASNRLLVLVWGGYQPSMYPEQALEDPLVDCVVTGLGEEPLLEICTRLAEGSSDLSGIPGVALRLPDGRVQCNDRRGMVDINLFPRYPWHLVDLERYVEHDFTERSLSYNSSMGCPFNCAFCGVISALPRGWSGYTGERVTEEVEYLVRRHSLDGIAMMDNNYFVDRTRARRISEMFLQRGLAIQWLAMGRARDFISMGGDQLALFKRSGLKCVFIGAESGSDRMLKMIHKEQTVAEVVRCTEILTAYGVTPHYSFTLGYPPEPEGDIEASLALVRRLKRINPEAQMHLGYYAPYHGTPLYRWALRHGFEEPERFGEWSRLTLDSGRAPWITASIRARVGRSDLILRTAFPHEDWLKRQISITAPVRATLRRLALRRWGSGSTFVNDLRVLHRMNAVITNAMRIGKSVARKLRTRSMLPGSVPLVTAAVRRNAQRRHT
ncbi:MAG: radical SAM protein [Acidobacteriota bacterium]